MSAQIQWIEDGGYFKHGDLVREENTGEIVQVRSIDMETAADLLVPDDSSLRILLYSPAREKHAWLAGEGLAEPLVRPWPWAVALRRAWIRMPKTRVGWGIRIGEWISGEELDVYQMDEDW